jgi:Fanconi anemia group M protein
MIEDNPLIRWHLLEKREYQLRAAETASRKNTLICMPTALGKTVIAALAAAEVLFKHWDRKILVMAPTRPLIAQHRETFLRLLRVKPGDTRLLTGELEPEVRMREWSLPNVRIYFATPQTVWFDHERGLRFRDFALMVADECHRARARYAYSRIAKAYVEECPYPLILGLTASPGASEERIRQVCEMLRIEEIIARTEEDEDVRPYVHPVRVEWREVEIPQEYRNLSKALRELELERIEMLRERGLLQKPPSTTARKDLVSLQESLQARAEADEALWPYVMATSEALLLGQLRELLESQGRHALLAFLEGMRAERKRSYLGVLRALEERGLFPEIHRLPEHPKLLVLAEVVRNELLFRPNSRILVFNHYRNSIEHTVEVLNSFGIRAERFVGQADKRGSEGMSQEEQLAAIERLRKGEVQVLVMSQVGEEGLDIPEADLVVFYEPVPSEIRFIQRKGRTGRVRAGRVVVLVAKGTVDGAYRWSSVKRAAKMRRLVERLNAELSQLSRGPEPLLFIANPSDLVPETESGGESGVSTVSPEEQMLKAREEYRKEMKENLREVYEEILFAGPEGISVGDIAANLGIGVDEVERAVSELASAGAAVRNGETVAPAGLNGRGSVRDFEVVRVFEGGATLRVDGKWFAALYPSDYSGPEWVLRKGTVFRARAELFHLDGRLHVRIFSVVQLLWKG